MKLEIRNIDQTNLNPEAFEKLVMKYCRSLRIKNDLIVTFDKRLTSYDGWHHPPDTHIEEKRHIIRLSPLFDVSEFEVFKYRTICTILHELKHAWQYEKHGMENHTSDEFRHARSIKNKEMRDYYSVCESQARCYENKHLNEAVDFYDACC